MLARLAGIACEQGVKTGALKKIGTILLTIVTQVTINKLSAAPQMDRTSCIFRQGRTRKNSKGEDTGWHEGPKTGSLHKHPRPGDDIPDAH